MPDYDTFEQRLIESEITAHDLRIVLDIFREWRKECESHDPGTDTDR